MVYIIRGDVLYICARINRHDPVNAPRTVVRNKLMVPAIREHVVDHSSAEEGERTRSTPSRVKGRNLFCHPYITGDDTFATIETLRPLSSFRKDGRLKPPKFFRKFPQRHKLGELWFM